MKWLVCLVFAFGIPLVATTQESALFTNVYAVPETFLSDYGERELVKSGHSDIYAAQRILEREGIQFQGDAMATFRKKESKLVVRNLPSQQTLVEAFIKGMRAERSRMIHFALFEVAGISDDGEAEPDLTAYNYLKPADSGDQDGAVTGVFGEPEFQVLMRELKEKAGVSVFDRASVVCRSKQSAVIDLEGERLGIHPVIRGDNHSVELAIQFPQNEEAIAALEWEQEAHRLTVWDGQVVAYSVRDKNDKTRVFFIKSQLIDPAGHPLNEINK